MTAEDIPWGLQLCRVSGWNQVEADWRVFLEGPGVGGWLAEVDGRVVGTVTFLRYGVGFSYCEKYGKSAERTSLGRKYFGQGYNCFC